MYRDWPKKSTYAKNKPHLGFGRQKNGSNKLLANIQMQDPASWNFFTLVLLKLVPLLKLVGVEALEITLSNPHLPSHSHPCWIASCDRLSLRTHMRILSPWCCREHSCRYSFSCSSCLSLKTFLCASVFANHSTLPTPFSLASLTYQVRVVFEICKSLDTFHTNCLSSITIVVVVRIAAVDILFSSCSPSFNLYVRTIFKL